MSYGTGASLTLPFSLPLPPLASASAGSRAAVGSIEVSLDHAFGDTSATAPRYSARCASSV
eukprot:2078712-Prymnesium_polylepis.1